MPVEIMYIYRYNLFVNKAALERGHVVSAAIVLDLMADLDLKVIP